MAEAPPPIDAVNAMLGVAGMPVAMRQAFTTCHSITSIDDFEYIKPADTENAVKIHNDCLARNSANRIGFVSQKKLTGLFFWYHDNTRRGVAIDPANFTTAAMNRAIRENESFKQLKDSQPSTIEVGKIEDGMNWFNWKESFVGLLELRTGVEGAPLARCTREDKPAGWTPDQATNPMEKLIYQLPLNGEEFDIDNASAWAEIKNVTLGTPTYEWIRSYDDSKDGRGAWLAILSKCEGGAANNKRLILASKALSLDATKGGTFYTNEYTFSFDKYATKLLRGYAVMERYRNAVAPETKVERLLAGINVTSAPIIMNAKEYIEDHLLGDWLAAVDYMSTKVTKQFPPKSTSGHKRKERLAAEVGTSGRGSGRGRGRGRGGRHGRGGGRQGRGNGHGRGGRNASYNGVDVSDVSYNFSNDEMTRMGREGRDYVFDARNRYRNGLQNGGRGRGGGGGRFQGRGGDHGGRHVSAVTRAGRGGNEQEEDAQALVVYDQHGNRDETGQNTNANHRAMEGRGGQAGTGFGRGAYRRGPP